MVCASCFATPSAVWAQEIAGADSTARVFDDITLLNTRDLDYGRLVVPRSGRVDMTPAEDAVCTSNRGIEVLDACQSAAFEGTGGVGFQIRVSLPPRRRINLDGPGRDLRLRRMSVGAGDGLTFIRRVNRNYDFTINDSNGAFEFFVGGRLLLRNNQAPGIYTGTFTVEVDYQ
ncbi:MAG: DUF4402 domain-containing protein [Erythrobacter sp.]|nr:DUF4402 domain-containing protein [Erythrobacter sp.]